MDDTCAPQVAKTLSERISQFAVVTLESCAYAGTGNVLKVRCASGLLTRVGSGRVGSALCVLRNTWQLHTWCRHKGRTPPVGG